MDNILSTELIDDQQLRSSEYYGYVYLTTNLKNGKKYIGAHKSSVFDESYKGSGKILKRAIAKHGWDNFSTEVLRWCKTEDEMFSTEKSLIEYFDCVNSNEYYNIMPGGHGGDNKRYLSEEDYERYREKVSRSKRDRPRTPKEKEQLDKIHQSRVGTHMSEESKLKSRNSNLGQKRSIEAKLNMSKNHSDVSGANNPFYGKTHSEESRKKISDRMSSNPPHKGKMWITNSVDELLIPKSDFSNYPGYVKGRLRKSQRIQKIKFND